MKFTTSQNPKAKSNLKDRDLFAPLAALPRPKFSNEDIARRAYQRWEEAGGIHGDDQRYWFEAERELNFSSGT